MQGRVIPDRLDKFQVFPASSWQKELAEIKEIGFDCVELLYDKGLVCKALLSDPENINELGINPESIGLGPIPYSMCIDYLSSTSVIEEKKMFYGTVIDIVEKVKHSKIKILVVPFFDENSIRFQQELRAVLDWCKECKLDDFACANDILLALELSLPALQIRTVLEEYEFNNIKVCYDLGNARAMGYYPENEIIELGDFICHVHIKDRRINGPNVTLSEGDVDFIACLKALKKIGYKGIMILETRYSDFPAIEAAKNLQFVNNVIVNSRL